MTTPNIDLYMPKTYIFERKNKAYAEGTFMTLQGKTLDFVYLPKGLSMVTITETAMGGRFIIALHGPNGFKQDITDKIPASEKGVTRLYSGQISNPGEGNQGLWLKVYAENVTTAAMNNGSVSVQIVNFPPEN